MFSRELEHEKHLEALRDKNLFGTISGLNELEETVKTRNMV
jgi:hypothetical protein